MRNRCYDKKCRAYRDYGGRGITVCDEWRDDFMAFVRDMGLRPSPKHSIDRIDNNKGYSPTNCRWATQTEQARNKRNVKLITANGKTATLGEWSEITGIGYFTLFHRWKHGWSHDEIVNTPLLPHGTKMKMVRRNKHELGSTCGNQNNVSG